MSLCRQPGIIPLVSGCPEFHHPSTLAQLRLILRLIEEYVPVQQIWVDMAEGDETQSQPFEVSCGGQR